MAQTFYDCANPVTVGVPDPRPLLGIGGQAFGGSGDEDEGPGGPDEGEADPAAEQPFVDLLGRLQDLGR
jgi:hypothetical protein